MDVTHLGGINSGPVVIENAAGVATVGVKAPVSPAHSLLVGSQIFGAIKVQIAIHVVGKFIQPELITG